MLTNSPPPLDVQVGRCGGCGGADSKDYQVYRSARGRHPYRHLGPLLFYRSGEHEGQNPHYVQNTGPRVEQTVQIVSATSY